MPRTTNLPKFEILLKYEEGATVQQLADTYERNFSTMRSNLHRWGAVLRRSGPNRTHTLNESYFDEIATERQAYWLGFLLADGSVVKTPAGNFGLRLELAKVDVDHLVKLKQDIGSSTPVVEPRRRNSAYVSFYSKRLCDGLSANECYPGKTCRHGTPQMRADLYRHFYRGVTDGDGSFQATRSGWRYELVGSPTFVSTYQQWLMTNAGVSTTKILTRGRAASMRYTGTTQVRRILNLLYENASVYLDRKHDAYLALV